MSINKVIKSVAVIGGGPAGIACVNELVHVSQNGRSLLETCVKPVTTAFDKVVCFEQNSKLGGVWNFFKEPDAQLPPLHALNRGTYNKPDGIYERPSIPNRKSLQSATREHPFVRLSEKTLSEEHRWHRNAAYKDLFTNVPEKYMRFSYTPMENLSRGRYLEPLVSMDDITDYLERVIERYDLRRHFRVNSGVERIEKVVKENGQEKWLLTIREKTPSTKVEQWYTEEFDAVVAANGHCNVPFIPKTEGLNEFVRKYPNVVKHSKSYRDANDYRNSKILLCGSGTSSADLLQYLSPVAKGVTVSQRSESVYPWIVDCFKMVSNVQFKPRISKYLHETGEVMFEDGTVGKYDHVILSTGYHYHFPFLNPEDELVKIYDHHENNSPVSKIGNLYLYTFSTIDNSFATAGIPTFGLMFHGMEYSAAAIAGVFSGSKRLPDLKDQIQWDEYRTKRKEPEVPHRFQGFFLDKAEEQLLNPLFSLAPEGRTNPLQRERWRPSEVDASTPALIKAFRSLVSGKCKPAELLK
ncbi:unnamed protein product [Pichia kudriavzevii]